MNEFEGWSKVLNESMETSRKKREEEWQEISKHINEPLTDDVLGEIEENFSKTKTQFAADILSMINEIRRWRKMNNRGLTLIEVMVFFIVLLTIASIVGPFFIGNAKVMAEKSEPLNNPTIKVDGFFAFDKAFGAVMRVDIPDNFELINVTWKNSNMWIFVKSKIDGHHEFIEKSSLGLVEAKVIFNK